MEVLSTISNWVWTPLAYVALTLGLYFTWLTRGVQFKRLPDMIEQLRSGKAEEGGLSSFQTLALTLSSRVGVGSIAGVATAIAAGGPGALMWMAITGILCSTAAYAEAVLAQAYKRRLHGEDRGGMPYYIKYGLKAPRLAVVLSLLTLVGYGFIFPGIQANNIASSAQLAFGLEPWVTGLAITGLLAVVILGGTKRIVNVAQAVIPFMAIGYMVTAVIIVAMNIQAVPAALWTIIASGLGIDAIFGGIIGYAVAWGVRRAIFASATGLGEGTFAAAAARASHPAKQGIIQAFSIYIDVILVCMSTGLMIVLTDSYHVIDQLRGGYIVDHVPGTVAGPNFVQNAIEVTIPGWGPTFVAIAVFLFAFTSQIFFFYVATTNLVFLLGEKSNKVLDWVLRLGALTISFVGSVISADAMWAIGDIGYGLIAWVNLASVVLLTPVVRKIARDYDRQRALGVDPTFDPVALGIDGAQWWEDEKNKTHAEEATAPPQRPMH